jgi:predicted MFS family arabinose efflux permease
MNEIASARPGVLQRVAVISWYSLGVLTLIDACHFLDRTVISIVAEPIRREFHLADSQLGLLTGLAYGVSFALAGLPSGYLIDRFNRRRLLAVAAVIWSSMTALIGLGQTYGMLVAARVLMGAAEAGGTPAAMAIIADLFPARLRSTALGVYYLGSGIGAAASAVIGAVVAVKYGWRAAFLVAGLPGIILGILVWTTLQDVRRGASESGASASTPHAPPTGVFRFLIAQPAVLSLFMAVAMVAAGMAAIGAWLPPMLMRNHGMPLGSAGFVTALAFGLFSSLGTLFGGLVADRLARRGGPARRLSFCAVMALLAVPAGVGAMLSTSTPVAVTLAFAVSFCGFTIFPSGFGAIMELVPPQMRGMATSCSLVISNLVGYGVGPYAVGVISTTLGGSESLRQGMAVVCAATMVVAAMLLGLAARWHAAASARCLRYMSGAEAAAI